MIETHLRRNQFWFRDVNESINEYHCVIGIRKSREKHIMNIKNTNAYTHIHTHAQKHLKNTVAQFMWRRCLQRMRLCDPNKRLRQFIVSLFLCANFCTLIARSHTDDTNRCWANREWKKNRVRLSRTNNERWYDEQRRNKFLIIVIRKKPIICIDCIGFTTLQHNRWLLSYFTLCSPRSRFTAKRDNIKQTR